MHFHLDRWLNDDAIREWLVTAYQLPIEAVHVGPFVREAAIGANAVPGREGSFPIDVYVAGDFLDPGTNTVAVDVARLQVLCRRFGVRALLRDELDFNGETYVLIDERADCWSVEVDLAVKDSRRALILKGPFTGPHGWIASTEPLPHSTLTAAIAEACQIDEQRVQLETWEAEGDSGLLPVPYPIVGSEHYRIFTDINLSQENRPWKAERDNAREWLRCGVHVGRRLGMRLCIHHGWFYRHDHGQRYRHCYLWDGATLTRVLITAPAPHG